MQELVRVAKGYYFKHAHFLWNTLFVRTHIFRTRISVWQGKPCKGKERHGREDGKGMHVKTGKACIGERHAREEKGMHVKRKTCGWGRERHARKEGKGMHVKELHNAVTSGMQKEVFSQLTNNQWRIRHRGVRMWSGVATDSCGMRLGRGRRWGWGWHWRAIPSRRTLSVSPHCTRKHERKCEMVNNLNRHDDRKGNKLWIIWIKTCRSRSKHHSIFSANSLQSNLEVYYQIVKSRHSRRNPNLLSSSIKGSANRPQFKLEDWSAKSCSHFSGEQTM